jgi:hypothetical protein
VTIDAYLVALRRLLPRYARLRALPEIREHLRDAAARQRASGASPTDAEVAATAEFGDVGDVARRLRSELAVRETRLAAALAVGAVAFFVFPLYVVPENSLPPAPWAEKPEDIAALQRIAIGLWLAAGTLAVASALLAWTRWSRLTWTTLLGAAVALAGSIAISVALVVRWFSYTPSTPNLALAAPFALACLATCAAASWWALSSRPRLVPHD